MADNIEVLSRNIESLNSNIDKLNDKLGDVGKAANDASSKITASNSSMLLMNQVVSNLGSSVPALTSAFQLYKTTQEQVNIACKAFAANPVGAVIQLIATALTVVNAVIDKFKERISASEELTNRWNTAMSALEPVMKVINAAIDVVVEGFVRFVEIVMKAVSTVSEFIYTVGEKFGLVDESFDKAANKAKQYDALAREIQNEELKRIRERAKSEAKQAELRDQIATAEGKNKVKLLEALKEEIKLQSEAEIALNRKRIRLMEYQQTLSATSYEERKALEELKAQTDKLEADSKNKIAKIDKMIKASTDGIKTDTIKKQKETTKALEDEEKKRLEIQKAYAKAQTDAINRSDKVYNQNQKLIDAQRKLEDERLKLADASEQKIIAVKMKRLEEDKIAEQQHYEEQKERLEQAIESGKLSREDLAKFRMELADLETQHQIEKYAQETEEYSLQCEIKKDIAKSTAEALKEQEEAQKEADEAEKERQQEQWDLANEAIGRTADNIYSSFGKLNKPQQEIISGMLRMADTWNNLPKNATKAQKAMSMVGSAIKSCTSIVNAYMDAEQDRIKQDLESGKISEEEAKKQFEKTKKVQIAMATISMLSGIAEAISNAMELGPIAGPIIGAINSAAVATAGALQIAEISKTTIEGGGNTSGNTGFVVPQIGETEQYGYAARPLLDEGYDEANVNRTVTTDSNGGSNQRVYIVEDDISDAMNRVQVREQSSTF